MVSAEGGPGSTLDGLADRYTVRLRALLPLAKIFAEKLQYADLDPYFYLEEKPPFPLPPVPASLQPVIDSLTPAEREAEELPERVQKAFEVWERDAVAKGPAAEEELIKIADEVEAQYNSVKEAIKAQKNFRPLLAGFALWAGVNPTLQPDAYEKDKTELSYHGDQELWNALRAELPGAGAAKVNLEREAELKSKIPPALIEYADALKAIEPSLFLN